MQRGKDAIKHLSALAVIISGCAWGMNSLFVGNLSRMSTLTSPEILFLKTLVGFFFITLIVLFKDRSQFRIRPRDFWMFLLTAISSIALNVTYFSIIDQFEASFGVMCLYISPLFVAILSVPIFREKITLIKLFSIAITILGCVLVSGIITGGNVPPLSIFLLGILTGFGNGAYIVFQRVCRQHYETLTSIWYLLLFVLLGTMIFANPVTAFTKIQSEPAGIPWILLSGTVSTVLPYLFFTWGVKGISAGRASILVASELIVGSLVGILVFHESHDVWKIVGLFLVFAAIILMNIKELAKKRIRIVDTDSEKEKDK